MKKFLKIITCLALLVFILTLRHGVVDAAAAPFTCSSNFYQVISGQFNVLDPVTGAYTPTGSNAGFDYNAIGYDTLNNYIYGFAVSGPNSGDLIQVASDGSITDLGLPSGLPQSGYINGSFDLSGNLYIIANNNTIYKVNIASMTTITITTTGDPIVASADNLYINNSLYTLAGSSLSVINLANDTVSTGTVSGPSGWLTGGNAFGAAWTDQAGEMFFSNNATGSIYQILNYTSATPTAVFKIAGTVTSSNDGTSCPLAIQNPFNPPIANNDAYTTSYNTTLHEIITPVLNNDVGNGLSVTSYTQPPHGNVTLQPNGTFIYVPDPGFHGTDSFTYTITDSFGRTAAATVSIDVLAPATPDTGYGAPISRPGGAIAVMLISGVALVHFGTAMLRKRKYTHPLKQD